MFRILCPALLPILLVFALLLQVPKAHPAVHLPLCAFGKSKTMVAY